MSKKLGTAARKIRLKMIREITEEEKSKPIPPKIRIIKENGKVIQ